MILKVNLQGKHCKRCNILCFYYTCKGTVTQGDIHHSHSIENQGAVFNTAATQKEESTTCTVSRNEKQCVVIRKQIIIEGKISF
jgi:hypothetical protein